MKILLLFFISIGILSCSNVKAISYDNDLKINNKHHQSSHLLSIKYLGNTSIYFEDLSEGVEKRSSVFIDAFLSRPSFFSYFGMKYDVVEINTHLEKAGISKVSYIIPLHSHFDHMLDASYVAGKYKSTLLATTTTKYMAKNIGPKEFGAPVKMDMFYTDNNSCCAKKVVDVGEFVVTVEEAVHPDTMFLGQIFAPLNKKYPNGKDIDFSKKQPAYRYVEGDSVNVHLFHKPTNTNVYVLGGLPAEYTDPEVQSMPENLKSADIVFIAVPIFKFQLTEESKRAFFWKELMSSEKMIIPVHWDNFNKKLRYKNCTDSDLSHCLIPFLPLVNVMKTLQKEVEFFQNGDGCVKRHWLTAFGEIQVWPYKERRLC